MGCAYRLSSRREGVCTSTAAGSCGRAVATSSAATTACGTDAAASESASDVQRSDPGKSADARARTSDELDLASDRPRWRPHCLHMECAGWNVQPANGNQHDVDRAESGGELSADGNGQ